MTKLFSSDYTFWLIAVTSQVVSTSQFCKPDYFISFLNLISIVSLIGMTYTQHNIDIYQKQINEVLK